MPWYWSDDIAKTLIENGRLDAKAALALTSAPVAFRSPAATLEEAAERLLDDDEIPLAA